jgi:hypothetical protein
VQPKKWTLFLDYTSTKKESGARSVLGPTQYHRGTGLLARKKFLYGSHSQRYQRIYSDNDSDARHFKSQL